MKHLIALGLAIAAAFAAPALAADDYTRLKIVRVQDTSGFERPVDAFHVLVPPDWRTEGGIFWVFNAKNCGLSMPYVAWGAYAPDGVSALEVIPSQFYGGMSYAANADGCPRLMHTRLRDYMQWLVQTYRPNARNYAYRDIPERAAELNQLASRQPTALGGEIAQYAEAGEASFEYTLNGRRVRERVALIVVFSVTKNPGALAVTINQIAGVILRGPAENPQLETIERFANTFTVKPGYAELIRRFNEAMQAIALKGVMERAAIWRKVQAEIGEIIMEVYQNAQDAYDRASHAHSRAIRGVSAHVDPKTGETIDLPSGGSAWQMPDGTIIVSDDPAWDPSVAIGEPGTRIEPDRKAR